MEQMMNIYCLLSNEAYRKHGIPLAQILTSLVIFYILAKLPTYFLSLCIALTIDSRGY